MARIGPELLRAQRRLVMARVLATATGPLAALTKLGERRLVPLADPSRRASGRWPSDVAATRARDRFHTAPVSF
jgi:hypothetical protein